MANGDGDFTGDNGGHGGGTADGFKWTGGSWNNQETKEPRRRRLARRTRRMTQKGKEIVLTAESGEMRPFPISNVPARKETPILKWQNEEDGRGVGTKRRGRVVRGRTQNLAEGEAE
jgi:hypothetical protein